MTLRRALAAALVLFAISAAPAAAQFTPGAAGGGDPFFPSAGNGYYVMLKPLPPGTHEIEFGAVLPAVSQAITYRLKVR